MEKHGLSNWIKEKKRRSLITGKLQSKGKEVYSFKLKRYVMCADFSMVLFVLMHLIFDAVLLYICASFSVDLLLLFLFLFLFRFLSQPVYRGRFAQVECECTQIISLVVHSN